MADELARQGYYSPMPSHDMWTFGLLLLDMVGGSRSQQHRDAEDAFAQDGDSSHTLAFAKSLLGGPDYCDQVTPCGQHAQACVCTASTFTGAACGTKVSMLACACLA